MKKNFLAKFMAFTVACCGLTPAGVQADTAASRNEVGIQRSFVNLDFQDVIFPANNQQVNQDRVPGWLTTHRVMNSTDGRIIEIWKGAGHSSAGTLPNAANDQYAELNAEENSALYQRVCLFGDEKFDWSLQHAARQTNTTETMEFFIGTVADQVPGSGTYTYTNIQTMVQSGVTRNEPGRWKTVRGTTTVSSEVPKTGGVYAFIFRAVNGSTLGNFLDNVVVKLRPAVEFTAQSDKYYEGDDSTNSSEKSIPFNIVGQIAKQADMPVLNFKIEYPQNYTKDKAVYGKNYKLYRKTKDGLVELTATNDRLDTSNPDRITFDYTPIYDSSLDYSTGVTVDGLVIKINGNTTTNEDLTIPVSFALDESSGAVVTSLKSCGGVQPVVKFDLVIKEDDVDLEVVKKLTPESTPVKDQFVSYTLDISNKSNTVAENIVLRDFLNTGLQRVPETELVCEDLTSGTSQACPATWATGQTALTSLFTNTVGKGLNLGDLPAQAKYKFTLKNLKVIDPQHVGIVKNTATVETLTMRDVDPSNNESMVESLIVASSDLVNDKVGASRDETGEGLFYIAKNGRTGTEALLSQALDQTTGKTYFPLKIKNSSVYGQDYKLHASRDAIIPTLQSDYSPLDLATIKTFTTDLSINFYPVANAECKAGLSVNSVSQIHVGAGDSISVCAEVIATESAKLPSYDIWFAIESLQTGLGDIIKNKVTYTAQVLRLLELVNDQRAQVAVGGTYVFLHRLFNKGTQDENDVTFDITPFNSNDGFAYTLFFDKNNDGQLDAQDQIITSLDQKFSVAKSQLVQLLLKVQAPSTATNGMMSQVRLTAIPNNTNQSIVLESLLNTDTVYVGSDQVEVTKMQFKQSNCTTLSPAQIKAANYSLVSQTIGAKDCLIYRITVKNIGSEKLSNVKVNDMYPAYTVPWKVNLPLIDVSNNQDILTDDGNKIEAILHELLPQQEKSLHFGIKMQF